MLEKGLIQVYTGTPGQFNFAPIGLAFRAAGHGIRSLIACLLPHDLMDGAEMLSTLLKPIMVIDHSSSEMTVLENALKEDEIRDCYQRTAKAALAGDFDIVILNDIHTILQRGIIAQEDVLALMEGKPNNVELVLTGPEAPEAILQRADLVTEMVTKRLRRYSERDRILGDGGYVEVVTGNGKGKTTYCLGKAILASCLGVRSIILQFIKSPQAYGEVKAIERFALLKILSMGAGFLDHQGDTSERKHLEAARKAWEKCLREIFSISYGLVVLDEINTATHYGLVNPERILELCSLKPQNLQLLLSGRHAQNSIMETADHVIEMREIKHPYRKGIKARRGIEY
jgi:cob(I)alamin adenosyltransferase